MSKKNRNKKRRFSGKKLKERTRRSQQNARSGKSVIDQGKNIPQIRFTDGRHTFDVIPYIAGKNDSDPGSEAYTFEYYQHKNVGPGRVPVICLQETFDKPCPACEHRERLREKGDENYKAWWPKRRNLYNVVCYDRTEKDKGVQVLDVTWHWMEKYLAKISEKTNRRTGETETIVFASPDKKEGRSIEFTIEPPKSENDYPDWIGHSFDRRDYDIDEDILEGAFVLDEIVNILDYDDFEELLSNEPKPSKKKRDRDDEEDDDDDDDDDDDLDEIEEEEDDDDDEEEEDDDDEPKKKKKKKSKYDKDDIEDMSVKELKKLVKKENLSIDPKEFELDEKDEVEDFREEIIDELGLD